MPPDEIHAEGKGDEDRCAGWQHERRDRIMVDRAGEAHRVLEVSRRLKGVQ
jgi:hypothetical protein